MAIYPGAVTAIAENKSDATDTITDHPAHHNELADELNAVTTELGVDPSGSFTTVAARLNARLTCRKTADQTINSTTLANVTDLVLPVSTTALDYYFKFYIPWSTNTAGIVAQFAITVPAVTGYVVYWQQTVGGGTVLPTAGAVTVTWDETMNASADAGAAPGGTSIPAANVITVTKIEGILSNPSATGNIQVQHKIETTTATITTKRGAYGELYIN